MASVIRLPGCNVVPSSSRPCAVVLSSRSHRWPEQLGLSVSNDAVISAVAKCLMLLRAGRRPTFITRRMPRMICRFAIHYRGELQIR